MQKNLLLILCCLWYTGTTFAQQTHKVYYEENIRHLVGAGAAVPGESVARECAAVVRVVGRSAADLAPVSPGASWDPGGGAEELQLRLRAAVVGHDVPDGGFHDPVCSDRRSVGRSRRTSTLPRSPSSSSSSGGSWS